MSKLLLRGLFLSLALLLIASLAKADTGSPLSGYAWSSNIGWINFRGDGYGVNLNGNTLSGYAWSPNIGWINFANVVLGQASPRAKALAASGTSGWDGDIALKGPGYEVTKAGDHLTGYAWGDAVVGWVDFSGVKINGLNITCNLTVNGSDAVWSASASGGSGGYSYAWTITDSTNNSISPTGDEYTLSNFDPGLTYTGSVVATDSAGASSPICTKTLGAPASQPQPSIQLVSGKERLEINSQPLTSPAISSAAQFALEVPLSSPSATLRIQTSAANFGEVSCRLSQSAYVGGHESEFVSCGDAVIINSSGTNTLYLNLRVRRPVQGLRDQSPYSVTVSIDGCGSPSTSCSASAFFDYRVGTVNQH